MCERHMERAQSGMDERRVSSGADLVVERDALDLRAYVVDVARAIWFVE